MDFTRALTFPFDDDEWFRKMGLATLVQFIPIVGAFALLGWSYEISRRVKAGDIDLLPDWQDFGGMLGRGFTLFIAGLVYQLPVALYICVVAAAWLIPVSSSGGDPNTALLGGALGFALCGGCVVILYALLAYLVYQAGYVRYLDRPELGTFFQFADNIALLREHLGEFGMFVLYMLLFGALASVVSSITAGLGGLVANPFSMTFTGHLLGQLHGEVTGAGQIAPAGEPAV